MKPIKLVNESALGIYRFSWKASTGIRCEVLWSAGVSAPLFSFFIIGRQRVSDPIPIRNPDRFGWNGPPRKLADFKAFAERFAQACEDDAE